MLRAAIIERNKEKREYILAGIKELGMEIKVVEFQDRYDFQESLDEEASSFDIILLNTTIHKEGDGVELASYIRDRNRKAMICFITESERYYREAFDVFATGYLLYPFEVGELHNCITFFYDKTKKERRASWMVKEKGGNYRRIYTRFIVYVESDNREIIIHLEDGSEIVSYAKLSQAEESLSEKLFLRCHQSYIVNLYFVEEINRNEFVALGNEIPISRKYQQASKDAYYDFMFEKV